MMTVSTESRLIENDNFPFEYLSRIADRESWRKEVHRPIYHVHKWWAKRLGSVFRGILLACELPITAKLELEFYRQHAFDHRSVFDPFMGSGTTIGEAHKLGFTALGRDINPVAVDAVSTAFGELDRQRIQTNYARLQRDAAPALRELYRSRDSLGRPCDVLYYFWVMQARCISCLEFVDLFPSYIIARNAYPEKKPEIQVLCQQCGHIFHCANRHRLAQCSKCNFEFDPNLGVTHGAKASCNRCKTDFLVADAVSQNGGRPRFRLYGKLVLTSSGQKEYLAATSADLEFYQRCSIELHRAEAAGELRIPNQALTHGHNTKQAMRYGFRFWRDFFNDRQLLALARLRASILDVEDASSRRAMLTLFSGVLEFNNLFASYKGEGTGAVRHMFSHHILKPERTPIEANVWGTPKSSGSFSTLYPSRLLRAISYRENPTETTISGERPRVCSPPFTGRLSRVWPPPLQKSSRETYVSCGDSSNTGLTDQSIDLVVTDPPFFDNVHYSELADFFFAWQSLDAENSTTSTRHPGEVQDTDPDQFSKKLHAVLQECHRILREEGLLVFTYHHSRQEGWRSLAAAILNAGFIVVNCHPIKAEMSVATPKSQAKEPIQFDIVIVCRKFDGMYNNIAPTPSQAAVSATEKVKRLAASGFRLSRNDLRIVLLGQMLTTLRSNADLNPLENDIEAIIDSLSLVECEVQPPKQKRLFELS